MDLDPKIDQHKPAHLDQKEMSSSPAARVGTGCKADMSQWTSVAKVKVNMTEDFVQDNNKSTAE